MPTTNVKPDFHELLQVIADLIAKSHKIVVITGAGISTNLGIPDFRSENGLYSLIQEQYDKVNAIQAQKAAEEAADQEAPRKRRKLNRTQSLGGDLDNADTELTISRRSLRSSKSMGFAEDLPSPDDEAPQQSTVGFSRHSTPSVLTFLPQAPTNLLSNVKGKDLFDATIWKDKKSTQTHYTFITSLKHKIDEVQDTSEVHKFIRVLRDGGRLVRNYTQNIDMLEKREGLCTDLSRGVGSKGRFNPKLRKESREGQDHEGGKFDNGVEVVQLHGNLEYLRCTLCLKLCDWEEDDRHLTMLSGEAPPCPHCIKKTETRQEKGRRGLSVGTLRPDIVLYGENNPHDAAIGDVSTHDIKIGPDMCIILGTSLKVHGLKLLLREFSKAVHDRGGKVIFVNNTKPSESIWGDVIDYWVEWDCDAWVRDVKARREGIWTPQGSSPETTPKLQHKQLPGCLPKSQQPKLQNGRKVQLPIPKHPQCMRIDYFCGAYMMDKIQRILRAQSGRGEDGDESKAMQGRIDQINLQLMRSGKVAEKLALAAAESTLEAIKAARRARTNQRRAEKRALDREAAKELEEEANDEAAAAQLQIELELPILSELPNMWNTTVQAMRKITFDPAWDSSHPIQPNTFEIHRLLAEQGWTYPSERDAAHAQRLADLVKDHERPAGERAPTRLESQAILFPDCNTTGKRKHETPSAPPAPPAPLPRPAPAREQFSMPLSSPASLASDKSNMAHITWNILGNVSQEVGRQRKLPETIAGQRTLFAELGREFTELPPPPTPAAAYELSNWSISSPRPATPATQILPVASPTSASSLGSQDPNGSNRNHIRSVFDLEHSHGMVPRLPRMAALAQPPTGADNARYAVRYMSAAPTPSVEEMHVSLSNAEPQLSAQAGMASSPPSATPAALSPPALILASHAVSQTLLSTSANVPSTHRSNEAPSQPMGVQMAAPRPQPLIDDPLDATQSYETSHGILFKISPEDFKQIDRIIKRCRFGLGLFEVCRCGLEALIEEEKGADRWNLTSFGAGNAARWLHLHNYRRDAIALLGSPMDFRMARRIVRKILMKECQDVKLYQACFRQPVEQRPPPTPASLTKEIQECPGITNPDHGCICQIQACINQWLLEGKLPDLNGCGAIQLSTLLHKTEYKQLAIKMILDKEPDLVNYSNAFASILGMTLDEDEFKRCYRVGRARVYARWQEIVEPNANASPENRPNSTPLKVTQSTATGDVSSSQAYTAAPSLAPPPQMSAPIPSQPNTTGIPNTPFSMAPFLHETGEVYVPPYDITRASHFGMTPTPIQFNLQYGQLPTPAPTPPTAADLKEEIAKLQRQRAEHRDAVNIRGRAWTLLGRRRDERKEKRIAELEYQLSGAAQGQERFLTPPDSDERSQSGSQYGGSQRPQPGYSESVDFHGFSAEQGESGLLVVEEEGLRTGEEEEVPMTPKAKRIKSVGSIEAILSSPPPVPPTLSRETEKLLKEYPKPNAKERKELEKKYPAVGKRKEPVEKRKSPTTKSKEPAEKKKSRQRRKAGSLRQKEEDL